MHIRNIAVPALEVGDDRQDLEEIRYHDGFSSAEQNYLAGCHLCILVWHELEEEEAILLRKLGD